MPTRCVRWSFASPVIILLVVAQPLATACSGDRPTFGRPAPDAAVLTPPSSTDAGASTDPAVSIDPAVSTDAASNTSASDEGTDGALSDEGTASDAMTDASLVETGEAVADTGAGGLEAIELGGACVGSDECASGYCVDGVCCNDACTGECQSCSATDSMGLCINVQGDPPPTEADCKGEGVCKGTCDGVSPDCQYPGDAVACSVASCSNATGNASAEAQCNAEGSCGPIDVMSCGNLACDGALCRTQCQHDGHCRDGATCVESACVKYQQKQILITSNGYGLGGGVAGADAYCQTEFGEPGATWKALLVGGGRTATITPNAGDGQEDWVVHPYTEYYNWEGRLLWVTHDVALLGVEDGQRVDLLQPATKPYDYPWSGYADDWTTMNGQTCSDWTSVTVEDAGAFAFDDLTYAAVEPCDRLQRLVCVEQ